MLRNLHFTKVMKISETDSQMFHLLFRSFICGIFMSFFPNHISYVNAIHTCNYLFLIWLKQFMICFTRFTKGNTPLKQ